MISVVLSNGGGLSGMYRSVIIDATGCLTFGTINGFHCVTCFSYLNSVLASSL